MILWWKAYSSHCRFTPTHSIRKPIYPLSLFPRKDPDEVHFLIPILQSITVCIHLATSTASNRRHFSRVLSLRVKFHVVFLKEPNFIDIANGETPVVFPSFANGKMPVMSREIVTDGNYLFYPVYKFACSHSCWPFRLISVAHKMIRKLTLL